MLRMNLMVCTLGGGEGGGGEGGGGREGGKNKVPLFTNDFTNTQYITTFV